MCLDRRAIIRYNNLNCNITKEVVVKKLLFSFIVIAIGITIFAGQRQIRDLARVSSGFTEGDMLIAKEEEPGGYYQPNWATDSLNVKGVGRVPYFGDARGVFIVDTFAYVCMGYNLVILNIKDKSNPQLIGYYDTPGYALGVYVSGNYAYVADGYEGLRIIDISTPATPTEVGYYDTPGYALGVYVSGDYTYIADDDGLYILDFALTGIESRDKGDYRESSEIRVSINEIAYKISSIKNEIEIYTIDGKKVYEDKDGDIGEHRYSSSNLTTGIYFIKFRDGGKEINKKVVIIR